MRSLLVFGKFLCTEVQTSREAETGIRRTRRLTKKMKMNSHILLSVNFQVLEQSQFENPECVGMLPEFWHSYKNMWSTCLL